MTAARGSGSRAPVLAADVIDSLRSLSDNDDGGILVELLSSFLATTADRIAVMQAAFAAGDLAKLTFEAHTLKSAAANLGASGFSVLCQGLEDVTAASSPAEIRELFAAAQTELVLVTAAMEAVVRGVVARSA